MEVATQTTTGEECNIPEIFDELLVNARMLGDVFKKLDEADNVSEDQAVAMEYQSFVIQNKINDLNNEIETMMSFIELTDPITTEARKRRLDEMKEREEFIKFVIVLYNHVTYLRSI